VEHRLVVDRPGMGGASSQGLPVGLAGPADVLVVDEREGTSSTDSTSI
jgi:hypothetical protein